MILEVLLDAYREPENTYLVVQMKEERTLVHPEALRRILAVLEAFPSQNLAYQRAARADLQRNVMVFAHSDPTHGSWKPFLTLPLEEALHTPLEEMREKVARAAMSV